GYIYARVTATVSVPLYFLPLVVAQGSSDVVSSAAAGQIPIVSLSRGVAPYTSVSTDPTGPAFGLVAGSSYDIQWPQYNGTRAHCGPSRPDDCFNSPTCPGETTASKIAVITNWKTSINGYWGGSANSAIEAELPDALQL